jgi:hypothetical protein
MSNKEVVYWKQRNGVLIYVDEMDINHLRNVLKQIVKNSNNYCEYCSYVIDSKNSHKNMCPNNHINFDSFNLHGNMANFFNDSQSKFNDSDHAIRMENAKLIVLAPKMKEAIDEVLEVLSGNGVPNIEWVKNRLLEAVK